MRFQNLPLKRDRKGITLLFVVSMIVLFMLLATTFLVVSSQYLRGARSYSKSEIFEREPQNDLDQVLYMLLRDSRDPSNPLRTHSLLADMYGYNTIVKGAVANGTARYVFGSDNTFIQVAVLDGQTFGLDDSPKALNRNKNSHLGQLFTITTGGMQGVTCRIVGHVFSPNEQRHYFRLYPYVDNFFTDATSLIDALNNGAEFIVNGRPFNGTGAGFTNLPGNDKDGNPNGKYDAQDSLDTRLRATGLTNQALAPNRLGNDEATLIDQYVGLGDVNEDYDAPDYQNCFLAAEVPSIASGYNVTVLPSFHRQALISNRRIAAGSLQARTLFRPNPTFHPDFPGLTGLDLETNAVGLDSGSYEWDVDNDMDRIKDSVWLDPNLPVVSDKSGRTYKRMFAILCRDMDGKFNLNAHGNRWHLNSEYTEDLAAGQPFVADENNPTVGSTLSVVTSPDGGINSLLPRGQGFGPPEVNMRTLVTDTTDFHRIMYGNSTAGVWGRNGQDSPNPIPRPGVVGADSSSLLNFNNVSAGSPVFFGGAYGSYPDIQGRMTFGVDYNGLPVFSLTGSATELQDNEYERNILDSYLGGFSKNTSVATNLQKDAPFSYAEIERILRGNDNDASSLPSRLLDLAPNTFNLINNSGNRDRSMFNRLNFGAHSFDVPSIPVDFVDELRQEVARGRFNLPFSSLSNAQKFVVEEELEEMLPAELFLHQPFNLNHVFGDGEDDNGDLVINNHWGLWSLDLINNPGILSSISESRVAELDNGRTLDLDNDGDVGTSDLDEHLVRYHNAKYLYVMMRMILRTSGLDPRVPTGQSPLRGRVIGDQDLDGNGTPNEQNDLAIFVAQWAINVVDFKDKDSIMTPFEFDLNPFNGWQVDGNPAFQDVLRDGNSAPIAVGGNPVPETTPYVVFGLEKPSLLMTETLAFHDRREEDTNDDTPGPPGNPNPPGKGKGLGNGKKKGKGKMDDDDNDQRLQPLGATFIELYNPRATSEARTADVHDGFGFDIATNNGIDLRKVSTTFGVRNPAGDVIAEERAPVWRIVMTRDNIDLDVWNSTNSQFRNRDQIERVIYFVREDANNVGDANDGLYLKAELQFDLPSRVLRENGMFLLNDTTYNALVPMTGISTAVIGTAAIPIVGSDSYLVPLGRKTNVVDENIDVRYDETRSITITAGATGSSIVVRDLNMGGNEVEYQKGTMGIPIEGLNISKPIGGYNLGGRIPRNALVVRDNGGGNQYRETVYFDGPGMGAQQYVFDGPLDRFNRPNNADNQFDNFPGNGGSPLGNYTLQGYRTLHLQRLANPLAGWHPRSNPYKTVDSMPIDLSVFDGVDQSDPRGGPANGPGPFDPDTGFGTKERGETTAAVQNRNIWAIEPDQHQDAKRENGIGVHFFPFHLEKVEPANDVEDESLGHTKLTGVVNFSYDYVNNPEYNGLSANTANASLVWNNRPFVGPYELMLVPHTSSSQLLKRFRSNTNGSIYAHDANSFQNGYWHLLNFFQGSGTAGANQQGPDFLRILDYVRVPSRFGFTTSSTNHLAFGQRAAPDLYLDIAEAQSNNDLYSGDTTRIEDKDDPGFRAPLNYVSDNRDPGLVNINTVFNAEIWEGVNGGTYTRGGHDTADNWPQFANSRRNNQPGTVLGRINGPTFFPTPYRSSTSGNLYPDAIGQTIPPANTGLLRMNSTGEPLMHGRHPTVNSSRHPMLRFLPRGRLDNLTSTRSNVFGVWITVGYFEVDEHTGQIGEEIGSSTGEVERHRAFYMIDRSIPVGFEPGKNHNVDKTIMLRRYIE